MILWKRLVSKVPIHLVGFELEGRMSKYKFDGKQLRDPSGNRLGEFDGKIVRDKAGTRVGEVDGKIIRDKNGSRMGEFDGINLRDSKGSRVATLEDVKRDIDGIGGTTLAAMWLLFIR